MCEGVSLSPHCLPPLNPPPRLRTSRGPTSLTQGTPSAVGGIRIIKARQRRHAIIVGSLVTSIVTVPCSVRPSRGPAGEGVMKVDLVCSWMGCMHWYI